MECAQSGCRASLTWFGHPTDPALAQVARESGWRVFEGKGWLCPAHQRKHFEESPAIRNLKGTTP